MQTYEQISIDERFLYEAALDLFTSLGPLNDLGPELANTVANVYYRFHVMSQSMANPGNALRVKPGKDMPANFLNVSVAMSTAMNEYKYIAKLIESLRETRAQNRDIGDFLITHALDTFKYHIKNADKKSLIRRSIERPFCKVNEIRNLYDRMSRLRDVTYDRQGAVKRRVPIESENLAEPRVAERSRDRNAPESKSISELGRTKFGNRFDEYCFVVGDTFKRLRDVVAHTLGYNELLKEGIGVSIDPKYRGVSIQVPYRARFVNPAAPEYIDPTRAAVCFFGTMTHELAHYKVPGHGPEFLQELRRILLVFKTHEECAVLKATLIEQLAKYQDVLSFLSGALKQSNVQQRVDGTFGYYPPTAQSISDASATRLYDLILDASPILAPTKSEMDALLRTWLALGEYQCAPDSYLNRLRKLLPIARDSADRSEFLEAIRLAKL